uniref:ORF27 n=1 Tax=Nitrosopumilaceae spindle-shaped virus TaxID=3065433 RepID=A0AAT9J9X2_9VIRU
MNNLPSGSDMLIIVNILVIGFVSALILIRRKKSINTSSKEEAKK